MKRLFLSAIAVFLTLTLFVGADIQSGESLLQIECLLKPIVRNGSHHHHSDQEGDDHHHRQRDHGSHPHIPFAESSSVNWSGYAALTSLNNPLKNSVTEVSGTWVVPQLISTSGTSYSATWVGIDGYSSNTVEQIGTEQEWINGSQQNYAWFEMYPSGAYEIVGFPVHVGDVITGQVSYVGNNHFQLIITNHTRNVTTTIPSSYTTSSTALRTSAEWIVEAPSSTQGVLPLADFGHVAFSNCTAIINGITGPINSSHWTDNALIMVTSKGVVKAVPSSLTPGGEGFSVTWEHQ